MQIRAASVNFLFSTLATSFNLHLDKEECKQAAVYFPFYICFFLLDEYEEFFAAFDATTGRLVKEEDGIKTFVSGSDNKQVAIEERFVVSTRVDGKDIPQKIASRIRRKKVRHIQTNLIYFPGVIIQRRRHLLLINLSAGTIRSLPKKHVHNDRFNQQQTLLSVFETEARTKLREMPDKSLPCLAGEHFVLWLIHGKSERLQKKVVIKEIVFSYTPFFIFKYYARRPRALKNHAYCSVSAVTGAWSEYAHKILEYDRPRNHGIIQQGNHACLIDEVLFKREDAAIVALRNLQKLPGAVNVRIGRSELIYFPLWTVHLEDAEFHHKIEICGVTGYIVFEKSEKKRAVV